MKTFLLAFDTETTNADPNVARVVQIAAILKDVATGEETVVMNEIVDPCMAISEEAAKIHGISQDMVQGKDKDFEAVLALTRVIEAIRERGDNVVLCGQNSIGFDLKIIKRLAKMSGCEASWENLPHVDTYIAAIRLMPDCENHQLSTLATTLGVVTKEEAENQAHDALFDIQMVCKILPHLMDRYFGAETDFLVSNAEKVLLFSDWLKIPLILKRIHFGKHRGKLFGKGKYEERHLYVPKFYIEFIVDKFTDPLPDLVATIRHHYGLEFKNV